MIQNFIFSKSLNLVKLLGRIVMSKNNDQVYYAVARGRERGIYNSWKDCQSQIKGVTSAKFRKFFSLAAAEEFMKNYESSEIESFESDIKMEELYIKNEEDKTKDVEAMQKTSSQEIERSFLYNSSNCVSPSPCQPSTFNCRSDLKSAEVLALNLRLDSFEKRFDMCLKEVGGILSQLSQIKSEIKDIKEAISFECNSQSPRKKREKLPSTLSLVGSKSENENVFLDGNKTFSGFQSPSSSWFHSRGIRDDDSDDDDGDSGEPVAKKSKNLKTKLIKNESTSSKKFGHLTSNHDDCTDDGQIHFTVDEDDYVQVYTDGACHSNGKMGARAGIGIWFGDSHPLNVSEVVEGSATNNSAEIQAARVAIELAIKAGVKKLKILTDSEFLINCVTRWIYRWKKNNWTLVDGGKVKNREELEKLDSLASKISVRWEKVEGHAGIRGNEMADRLAKEGAFKLNR